MGKRLFASALVFFLACSPTTEIEAGLDGVALQVEAPVLIAGDTVTLALVNHSSAPIYQNLCFSTFQRRVGSGWTEAAGTGYICAAIGVGLGAGERTTFAWPLGEDLAEGTYRFRTTVSTLDWVDHEIFSPAMELKRP